MKLRAISSQIKHALSFFSEGLRFFIILVALVYALSGYLFYIALTEAAPENQFMVILVILSFACALCVGAMIAGFLFGYRKYRDDRIALLNDMPAPPRPKKAKPPKQPDAPAAPIEA